MGSTAAESAMDYAYSCPTGLGERFRMAEEQKLEDKKLWERVRRGE